MNLLHILPSSPNTTSQPLRSSFSINFEVTKTFLAIRLVDTARLSGDSHCLPSDYNIFQNDA